MARSKKQLSSGLKKIHKIARKLSKSRNYRSARSLMKAAGRVYRKSKCSEKSIRNCTKKASRMINSRKRL